MWVKSKHGVIAQTVKSVSDFKTFDKRSLRVKVDHPYKSLG